MPPFLPRLLRGCCLLLLLPHCTDPVVPAFTNETGFYLVQGTIADRPNLSEARISRSELIGERYRLLPVRGATVSAVTADGTEVAWRPDSLDAGLYLPPPGFAASRGRAYRLRVVTPEGLLLESTPEAVPDPVPLTAVDWRFEQRSYFRGASAQWVPAIHYTVRFADPAGIPNYYRLAYRYVEVATVCASCTGGRWRDGECLPDSRNEGTWDYPCQDTCFQSTFRTNNETFSDEFTDGGSIAQLEVARIDHVNHTGGQLLEAHLMSISRAAFTYLRTLRDLAEDGGGLNATLPAALVGNVVAVGATAGTDPLVLGYVGTAAVGTAAVYLDRRTVPGQPLPNPIRPRLEPPVVDCSMIPLGCPPRATCLETRYFTSRPPAGWGE